MADNLGYDPGSSVNIATDDVSGVHYQRMKIVDGTAEGTTALVVSSRGAAEIEGPTAHDAASAANPVLVGAHAVSAEQTAVANADLTRLITDLVGKLIVLPYANPENLVSGKTAAITDTTNTQVLAAAGAGVRNYVTTILVTNSHATVGTLVKINDGSTEIFSGYAAAAGGGFAISLVSPLRGTANTAINAQCGTTGANVYVSITGYKGV